MPNNSNNKNLKFIYKRGADKERAVIRKLKEEGYSIGQRTAGSHGVFDVIAINIKERKIKLVQSKSSITHSAKCKIMIDNRKLNGKFKVGFEVWS